MLPQFQYKILRLLFANRSLLSCVFLAPALLLLSLPPPLLTLLLFFCSLALFAGDELEQGARTPSLPRERRLFLFIDSIQGLQGNWEQKHHTGRAQIPVRGHGLGAALHAFSNASRWLPPTIQLLSALSEYFELGPWYTQLLLLTETSTALP